MLHAIAQSPWVERTGWVLVHSLWQFALVALLAGGLQWAMRRRSAAARYAALLAAMLIVVALPAATWFVIAPNDKPAGAGVPALAGLSGDSRVKAELQRTDSPTQTQDFGTLPPPMPIPALPDSPPAEIAETPQPALLPEDAAPTEPVSWFTSLKTRVQQWLPAVVLVWLGGVALFAFRPLLSWYTVLRLRRVGVSPVADCVREALDRTAKKLRLARAVAVLQSTLVKTPLVVGYFRPLILLPLSVATGLPESQLELILAHELAHIRRHDYLVNLLQTLVETLFFYHPAVWWLSRQIRQERENCCDDVAISLSGNRADYGRALLAIEELRAAAPALAVAAGGGRLLARIRRIAGRETTPRSAGGVVFAALVVPVAILALVLWGSAPAAEKEKTKTDDQPGKSSIAAVNAHERAATGEKAKDSGKPNASTVTSNHTELWSLGLKEAIRLAIRNSRTMRHIGVTEQSIESKQSSAPSAGKQAAPAPDKNRLVIARANTDVALTEFEASVCKLVSDVETAYWDLYLRYGDLDIAIQGRERALRIWQTKAKATTEAGRKAEAEAREQYFGFKVTAEQAQVKLVHAESRLRFLIGIAASDGRRIEPVDEPSTARLSIDWEQARSEALRRSPAIREARWRVKQRELELSAAEKYVVAAEQNDSSPATQKDKDAIAACNLALAREKATLRNTELEVTRGLADALGDLEANQLSIATNFNRQAAAERNMEAVEDACKNDPKTVPFDVLLEAQRMAADAQGSYLHSLTDYAKAVSKLHYHKGTLLDYHGIELAERPDQQAIPERSKQSTIDPSSKSSASKSDGQITFAGLCHDEHGRPIAGAEVFLYRVELMEPAQKQLQTVRTDRAGQFRFAPVADLAKNLSAEERSIANSAPYWIIAKADGRATAWAAEPPDDPRRLDLRMLAGATLSGTITGPDGKPVKGAVVTPFLLPKPVAGLCCATTDEQGHFTIGDLEVMDVTLPPEAPGGTYSLADTLFISCRGFADKMVDYGKVPGKVDARLDLAAVVEGRVVNGKDGGPAAGVRVRCQGINEPGWGGWGGTHTDQNGRYRFDSLGPYKYNIWASADGYTMRAIDSFEAVRGTTKSAPDIQLVRGGFIVGHVVDADTGQPFRPSDAAAPPGYQPDVAMYGPARPRSGAACEAEPIQEDGSFKFRAAPGINQVCLRIFTRTQAVPPDVVNVDVTEGQTVKIEFEVRRKPVAPKEENRATSQNPEVKVSEEDRKMLLQEIDRHLGPEAWKSLLMPRFDKDLLRTKLKVVLSAPKAELATVRARSELKKQDIDVCVLPVTIENKSSQPIRTSLAHEWYGGIWPPTDLYAAVLRPAAAGRKADVEFKPVFLAGDRSELTKPTVVVPGKSTSVSPRLDWPGTGSVMGGEIVYSNRPGVYVVMFMLVFQADGVRQFVTSEPISFQYQKPDKDVKPKPAALKGNDPVDKTSAVKPAGKASSDNKKRTGEQSAEDRPRPDGYLIVPPDIMWQVSEPRHAYER